MVGTSGTLLLSRRGGDIDGHGMVFRADTARAAGFEAHVGSNTDVRVTDRGSWGFAESAKETCLLRGTSAAALDGLRWAAKQARPPPLAVSHPDFDSYVAGSFSFVPSSALHAVLLAMQVCQRVTLFGLMPPADETGERFGSCGCWIHAPWVWRKMGEPG